jgi:hypothetical protein
VWKVNFKVFDLAWHRNLGFKLGVAGMIYVKAKFKEILGIPHVDEGLYSSRVLKVIIYL